MPRKYPQSLRTAYIGYMAMAELKRWAPDTRWRLDTPNWNILANS
jgi:hypothetical protein